MEKLADNCVYTVAKLGLFPFQFQHDFDKSICSGIRHLDLHIGCPLLSLMFLTYYLISFASGSSPIKWRHYTKVDNINTEHLAQDLAQNKHPIQVSLSSSFVYLASDRYNQHTHASVDTGSHSKTNYFLVLCWLHMWSPSSADAK